MYIDMLTRIKNAQAVGKEKVKVPYSKMDEAIANILARHKFIHSVEKKGRMPKRVLEIKLNYDKNGKGAINGVKFLSKPSRKLYAGYKNLRPVKQGYGIGILSTPKGIITNSEAVKQKVGGQLLFEVW